MTRRSSHRPPRTAIALAAFDLLAPAAARAQSYDLKFDWSNAHNPSGAWTYREGARPLPPIGNWDPSSSTNWMSPQGGWALGPSHGGLNGGGGGPGATPFLFKSNGAETFDHDWVAGDIILRTRDAADGTGNGAAGTGSGGPGTGNGHANFVWVSPLDGLVTFTGTVWPGRSPTTFHEFMLNQNGTGIWYEGLSSSSNYTRADPLSFQITNQAVLRGDPIEFKAVNSQPGSHGDFFGVNLNIIVCIGLTQHPAHALICPAGSASVSVQARTSYGAITYRWRKDDVPLLENGGGGRYHGVFGPTLSITGMTASQAGRYDCVVGSVCSTLPSEAATVTICRADFDCSGTLAIQDVFEYLSAWFASDPRADVDAAAGLTMNDVVEFVSIWFAGCD